MNKFINDPDSLASLAGCAFWLFALAGLMSLFFTGILGVLR
jgi:hypothetical protein